MIPLVSISEISSLYLVSVTTDRFESTRVTNPEDRVSRDEAHYAKGYFVLLNLPTPLGR